MQPDRDPANWQQPNEQPSQAPFVPNPSDTPTTPVVTMSPDQPTDPVPSAAPMQPLAPEEEQQVKQPVDDSLVRWQASEYIHRHKSPLWYTLFVVITLVLTGAALFLKEYTFAVLVPVMAAALFMYTRRPPHVIDYTLSRQGLHVNDHLYPFAEFKGFGVIHDDDEYSVMLIPTKRFKPGVSVYFPEEAGEAIVDMLGARLPMQELKMDAVDRIIRKLRI
ncbi:MAG TPA: hypothetical protein VFZ62_00725 [Candidatus Saccharimonadales bacterium]